MTVLRISDLPAPVVASKSDWLAGDSWLGFTPRSDSGEGRAKCQSTVNRQCHGGYVLEYITEKFEKPNAGFETDPEYLENRSKHSEIAGRLIAVHRLRPSARPLVDIMGNDDFERLQDMWSRGDSRSRWSVAFPIVESFEIIGRPKARDVFGAKNYTRLYGHSSAVLRPIAEEERGQLASLEIAPALSLNAWIGIEDEFLAADSSEIEAQSLSGISGDIADSALEGMTEERKAKVRRRAAWLADRFVRQRRTQGQMYCDTCGFDPTHRLNPTTLRARSLLDVHHKSPLDEGVRYTTVADFALLCPTCHRLEHLLMRKGASLFRLDDTTRALLA